MGKIKTIGRAGQDFSSFLPIVIMTVAVLISILVINTVIIASNPENIRITSIIRSGIYVEGGTGMEGGSPFPFGNKVKDPSYLDVYRDRVIVYPGGEVVPARDLEIPGNAVEKLLSAIETNKANEYLILLVRPRAAIVARRLRKSIYSRAIDVGFELFEEGRPTDYDRARAAVKGQ